MTSSPSRIEAIYVRPIAEGVEAGLLHRLAGSLDGVFGVPCWPNREPLAVEFAFDAVRGQYHSTAILQHLQPYAAGLKEVRLLGVTGLDLFVPVLTFVFGEAQLEGRCALISLHRLHEEFYGLPPDNRLLEERALKEAVHELGHTFGLKHCPDWQCVMASTHAVERLDLKGADFCRSCRKLVRLG